MKMPHLPSSGTRTDGLASDLRRVHSLIALVLSGYSYHPENVSSTSNPLCAVRPGRRLRLPSGPAHHVYLAP